MATGSGVGGVQPYQVCDPKIDPTAAASFITTKDDIVGNAIEDAVVGQTRPGYNWFIKRDDTTVHGYLKLEMR